MRPGARLAVTGIAQPAAARDAHIEEHGVQGRAEVGLLYDAWVIPVVSVGTGKHTFSDDRSTSEFGFDVTFAH